MAVIAPQDVDRFPAMIFLACCCHVIRPFNSEKDKTLRILNAHDDGSDHCQEDNRQVGVNLVADWLAERLSGKLT